MGKDTDLIEASVQSASGSLPHLVPVRLDSYLVRLLGRGHSPGLLGWSSQRIKQAVTTKRSTFKKGN